MHVKNVMTPRVQVVHPRTTLKQAAQIMKVADVGPLPVCDGDRLVGMLTDRDITLKAVAEGKDPARTPVSDAMTSHVLYCFETDDINKAAKYMETHQVRRLVVLNRSKRLVGIVSLGDLSKAQNERLTGEVVREITKPAPARRERSH